MISMFFHQFLNDMMQTYNPRANMLKSERIGDVKDKETQDM